MTLDEYISAIKASTSKAELDSLGLRGVHDDTISRGDQIKIGLAYAERVMTPICEL